VNVRTLGVGRETRAVERMSPALRWYLWAVYLAAIVLVVGDGAALAAWSPLAPGHRALWPAMALFVALAYLAERQTLPVTVLLWWSLDGAVYIAAILLFPAPFPLVIALPAILVEYGWRWRDRLPRHKRAFNVAHRLLVVGFAAVLFAHIGAPADLLRPGRLVAALPALAALGVVYHVLDGAPVLVAHTLDTGRTPWRVWMEHQWPVAPFALADFALGVLAALAWSNDPLALGLLALPLLVHVLALRVRARAIAAEERAAAALAAAATDGLTGLLNHRAFQERLEEEVTRAARHGRPLALLMLDLDDFRAINNAHGHQAGDALLVAVAAALRGAVRAEDVPARYGGDEFAVILPEAAPDEALSVAERVRTAIADASLGWEGATIRTGVSVGLAVIPRHARTREGLIQAADRAAYAAKDVGKGQVRMADGMAAPAAGLSS